MLPVSVIYSFLIYVSHEEKNATMTLNQGISKPQPHVSGDTSGMATVMKEAHVNSDTSVTLYEVEIPKIIHPSQLLVKVVVSGTNPKVG